MTDKITICISSYNAHDTIANAIMSAEKQDWPNKEIIIVDDCSTDESVATIEKTIKNIPFARLIKHEKNKGVAGSANTLIQSATGDFLAFFDDDDISDPKRIRLQYELITQYESSHSSPHVICYAGVRKLYENGYEAHTPAIGSKPQIPIGNDLVRYQLYLERNPAVYYGGGTPNCAVMARASAFRAVWPYDETLRRNEDADFSVRMGLLGAHFIGTQEVLVTQHATGGLDKRPEVAYKSDKAFLHKHRDILIAHDRYEFALAWCEIKYHHYSGKDWKALLVFLRACIKHPVLNLSHLMRAAPRRLKHEKKMRHS